MAAYAALAVMSPAVEISTSGGNVVSTEQTREAKSNGDAGAPTTSASGRLGLASSQAESAITHPADLPGLAAFWPLDEVVGSPRRARGGGPAVNEAAGPVASVEGGVFGSRVLKLRHGQWLEAPRTSLGALDIHGPDAEVTLVAWFRRDHAGHWQAVAGVWDESLDRRQYCLFATFRKHLPVIRCFSPEKCNQ
jgi:hypothetical protein